MKNKTDKKASKKPTKKQIAKLTYKKAMDIHEEINLKKQDELL